jgi:hypothetical protein
MNDIINAEKAKTIDLSTYRNQTGTVSMYGLTVNVSVKDARIRFGHLDLLITPVNGAGEKWMEARRIDNLFT